MSINIGLMCAENVLEILYESKKRYEQLAQSETVDDLYDDKIIAVSKAIEEIGIQYDRLATPDTNLPSRSDIERNAQRWHSADRRCK